VTNQKSAEGFGERCYKVDLLDNRIPVMFWLLAGRWENDNNFVAPGTFSGSVNTHNKLLRTFVALFFYVQIYSKRGEFAMGQ